MGPRAGLDGRKVPDRPARSELLYRLNYLTRILLQGNSHLSGLIGTASHPDMQEVPITVFFFENGQHWQFEVVLLLFTACTCV